MFSCIPCLLSFPSREEQVAHVRSDLHQYNLRRRVADLPAVTPEEFTRKLELLEDEKACTVTSRARTRNRKQKEGHRSRQRTVNAEGLIEHVSQLRQLPPDATGEQGVHEEPKARKRVTRVEEYDPRFCLFDNHVSLSLDDNLTHMKTHHALYFHDQDYLKDLNGFISYLGRKVFEGHQCLYCNKPFTSVEAVRKHMKDRGHTLIGTHLEEHVEEYEPFYDYTMSYQELHIPDSIKAKLPLALGAEDDQDEWEVVEEYEEEELSEGTTVIAPAVSKAVDQADSNDDNEPTWEEKLAEVGFRRAFINAQDNLVLPSDAIAPHRKYYRQGKVVMPQTKASTKSSSVVPLMIMDKSHAAWAARANRIARRRLLRSKQSNDMRLGVKSNRLYRYIARKNKIFI